MNLKFKQVVADDEKRINFFIINLDELDEQQFVDQMNPVFYRVSPGLDDMTGRLIPGHKSEETLAGPHFITKESELDGFSHVIGVSVHASLVNDLVSELINVGHEVVLE